MDNEMPGDDAMTQNFFQELVHAVDAAIIMDLPQLNAMSQLVHQNAADNKLAERIVNCEYHKVIEELRAAGGRNPNDTLYFGPGEMPMTGLEYAVWRLDLKMVAIFFVFGGDPSHNACDGYVPTYASVHGDAMPAVLHGFRTEQGESIGVQAGYVGLRALQGSVEEPSFINFDAVENPLDQMSSALWLMEAHGRTFSVPRDITATIHHLEYFPLSIGGLDRVMIMLLCLNRVGITPHLAMVLVGDVLQAEIMSVFKLLLPQ